MKVLQFAFDSREDSDYLPYHYDRNSVVYTGTHDNATTYSFFDELKKEDKDVALRYMNRSRFTSKKKLTWDLIALAMGSVSDLCIIPAQDYLSAKFGKNKYTIDTWRQLEMADGRWRV